MAPTLKYMFCFYILAWYLLFFIFISVFIGVCDFSKESFKLTQWTILTNEENEILDI